MSGFWDFPTFPSYRRRAERPSMTREQYARQEYARQQQEAREEHARQQQQQARRQEEIWRQQKKVEQARLQREQEEEEEARRQQKAVDEYYDFQRARSRPGYGHPDAQARSSRKPRSSREQQQQHHGGRPRTLSPRPHTPPPPLRKSTTPPPRTATPPPPYEQEEGSKELVMHPDEQELQEQREKEQKERMISGQKAREDKALETGDYVKNQRCRYYHKGSDTWYNNVVVAGVHHDDGCNKPYYTIQYHKPDGEFMEKQTTPDRMEHVPWDADKTWEILLKKK